MENDPKDVLLFSSVFNALGIHNPIQIVPDGMALMQYLKGEGPYQNRRQFPIPELILLDLEMPFMSGFQVLDWLRKEAEFRHLPVVVITKSVFAPEVTRAYRSGANSFLTKPQDLLEYPAALKQVIDFWLAGDQDERPAA